MHIIIDSKYKKADLNKVMAKQFKHINATERYRLLNILNKLEYLFDCTLATWNTTPVDLRLKGVRCVLVTLSSN